jgi:hypothetical protein
MHYEPRIKVDEQSEGTRTEEQVAFDYLRKDTSEEARPSRFALDCSVTGTTLSWQPISAALGRGLKWTRVG